MLNVNIETDTMKTIFSKVIDSINTLETNPSGFYEAKVLPLVSERHKNMLYLKIKSIEVIDYTIGLTLENGQTTKADSNIGMNIIDSEGLYAFQLMLSDGTVALTDSNLKLEVL